MTKSRITKIVPKILTQCLHYKLGLRKFLCAPASYAKANRYLRRYSSTATKKQKVLFVMPAITSSFQPSLGLAILCTKLTQAGYDAIAVDYSYLQAAPNLKYILSTYKPDIVAVSVFSLNLSRTQELIKRVLAYRTNIPIVVGGPHITLSTTNDFADDFPNVVTQIKGEADIEIVNIIDSISNRNISPAIRCAPINMKDYVYPNFDLVLGGDSLKTYPMQLTRGCPFHCIFCNVNRLSGSIYRKRDIADCINEIELALQKYPSIDYVKLNDDAPNCDAGRFEEFLELYVSKGFRPKLEVMQMRADTLTLKMCQLLKKANAPAICLGVESADSNILKQIQKGETLEDIERACTYVKSCDIPLVLCFVIGLPNTTQENDEKSLDFAQRFQPIHCYWNIAQPMPETEMLEYFKKHGRTYSDNIGDSSTLDIAGCVADTLEYSRLERMRMQCKAQATTNEVSDKAAWLEKARRLGIEHEVSDAINKPRPILDKKIPRRW